MAIDSYTKLISEIQEYLRNDDLDDARTKEFIALAENAFDLELRVAEMITTTGPFPIGTTGKVALPADWNENRAISIDTGDGRGREVSYVPAHVLPNLGDQQGGIPIVYTRMGRELWFSPRPAEEYTYTLIQYDRLTPKLSDTVATNWLLAKAPQLYLYGSLIASAPFFEDDERLQTWITLYSQAKKSLHSLDSRGQYAPASRQRPFATGIVEGRRSYPGSARDYR